MLQALKISRYQKMLPCTGASFCWRLFDSGCKIKQGQETICPYRPAFDASKSPLFNLRPCWLGKWPKRGSLFPVAFAKEEVPPSGGEGPPGEAQAKSGGGGKMSKQLMLKPEKCTGCRTCELICSYNRANDFNPRNSAARFLSATKRLSPFPSCACNARKPAA